MLFPPAKTSAGRFLIKSCLVNPCLTNVAVAESWLACEHASRLNVTDHGSLRTIREDAGVLARYLNRPVWDAIDDRIPEQLTNRG